MKRRSRKPGIGEADMHVHVQVDNSMCCRGAAKLRLVVALHLASRCENISSQAIFQLPRNTLKSGSAQ
jgi:hypothetical protein